MFKKLLVNFLFILLYTVWTACYFPIFSSDYVKGRVIVKFKKEVSSDKIALVLKTTKLNKVFDRINFDSVGLDRIYLVNTSQNQEKTLIKNLLKNKEVEYAEPDYLAYPVLVPNDPYYSTDNNNIGLWYRNYLNFENAWEKTTGSQETVIAIIDSGIDTDHQDLQSRLWNNQGWNVVTKTNNIEDDFGHGTAVAGVLFGNGNNNIGITGVNWQSPILVIKANALPGVFNYSSLAAALNYADSFSEVKVINMSVGGYSFSNMLQDAVNNVLSHNRAVLVAGIGNDGVNISQKPFYPASFRGVLAVGGYSNGLLPEYSYGHPIKVVAPAKSVYTTFMGGDYGYFSGTSTAVPFVTGLASLVASRFNTWTAQEIKQTVIFWADCPADSLNCPDQYWTDKSGYGAINPWMSIEPRCFDSLNYYKTTIDINTPKERAGFNSNETIWITGTVISNNFSNYQIEWGYGSNPNNWQNTGINLVNQGNQSIVNGNLAQWNLSAITQSGLYQFRVKIMGESSCREGRVGEDRFSIFINYISPTPTLTPTPTRKPRVTPVPINPPGI